jgi:hypothetical protein
MTTRNAYKDLKQELLEEEYVESVVFGDWGWSGYEEPDPPFVPKDKKGVLLTLEEAKPYMNGWSLFSGFGSPQTYAINVWTNKRVLWITQYDGSTSLDSVSRFPVACMPDMPGG